jgi:microtubule-associated protein-like 6
MGQLIGKARLTKESQPFSNLSTEAIQESWDKFNEVAEGFGVSMDVFKSICGVLVEEVALGDEDVLSDYAEAIFRTFDTDENDLVDALEFLASFALISGMDLVGKVKFMFDCYDFDESGQLTIDEMTLSLKSTITGLAKLTDQEPPTEQDLETISQDAFRSSDLDSDQKISFEEFLAYCRTNPEVRSFVDYYDGLPEQWGTWDELNNTEVATEMTRDRLTARQLATLGGVDYCGLRPGDLAPFEKALHGDDGTRMWGVACVLRRLLLLRWLYMVGLLVLLLLVLAALGIFPGTFFVAPSLGDHCCGNFRDNFLTTSSSSSSSS